MAIPNLTNTWKVTYKYHAGLVKFQNVIHVQADFSVGAQTIANECGSSFMVASGPSNRQSTQVIHDTISVQKYDGASAPLEATVGSYSTVAGGTPSNPAPSNVCAIGTLRTALGGRSFRGRMYLGGLTVSLLDATGAQWSGGALTTLSGLYSAFLTSLNGQPNIDALVVYSHKLNEKTPVTTIVARQYFGTHWRRSEQLIP